MTVFYPIHAQYMYVLSVCIMCVYVVYWWSELRDSSVPFKKWLFLPADEDQILNRNFLYGTWSQHNIK